MRKEHRRKKRRVPPKTVLRLPDLVQAKSAVLNSLTSLDAQRGYRHAIDEFVEWYCSEPRLSFNRTAVSGTGSTSNHANRRRVPSTCDWERCDGGRSRRLISASPVLTWRPEYIDGKASRRSECEAGIGLSRTRPSHCLTLQIRRP
jgi:hypothetical protein